MPACFVEVRRGWLYSRIDLCLRIFLVLSIIVPARNNAQFTAMCLASILFTVSRLNLNCEFILVDDASAPDEKILAAFRQHRANAVVHETKIVRSRKHQHYSGVFSIG